VPSSLAVRVVFGVLVAATISAFFVTQRLKRSTPVIERVFFHQVFSPNGDGRKDTVRLRFDLPEPEEVTVFVVDEGGDEVATLAEERRLPRGTHRFTWDGRADGGGAAPDGRYRLRVTLRGEGRSVTAPRRLELDTTPPRPRIVAATPPNVTPGLPTARGRVRIRYRGDRDPAPVFTVFRTDGGDPRRVRRFEGPRFRGTAVWDGRLDDGSFAPEGTYAIAVTTQDRAGNRGSAPARLPPSARAARPRTGVTVRYLTVDGPLEPVAAGAIARFTVDPVRERLRWTLSRTGGRSAVARGDGGGEEFAVRVPLEARAGLHVLRVEAGGRRALVPLAVRGDTRPVLVVLPAITWQGENEVDDDRDGFPDTLSASRGVRAERPFARARLPAAAAEEAAPLLRYLDREDLEYELTTDLALAAGRGPDLRGRPGVALAGSARWSTPELARRLRRFAADGGRIALFGVDSLGRTVELRRDLLDDPSRRRGRNALGEATRGPLEMADIAAPLVVDTDTIRLFQQTDGFIGLFRSFELSRALPEDSELIAAAGREPGQPAFVAYRLGAGIVIRVGTPRWSAALISRPEVGIVTRRIWSLLGD
jgi:hypothetical protein